MTKTLKQDKNWQYYTGILLRKAWYSLAILLVSVAVLLSVVRYSLPHMDSQKHRLEAFLSEEYGAPIKIGYISAVWKGKGPAIVLKDVFIDQNENSPLSMFVEETQIELNFWNSLQSRQIQSERFNLVGMELEVDVPRIRGEGDDFPIIDALQNLFLERLQRFSVSASEVLLKTRLDEQRIQIQQLSWLNQGERHQGVGQMQVIELARNSASFVMDLRGSKDDFEGTFYADGVDLDLSPWIKVLIPTEYELRRSRGNFKVWAGIKNTDITFVQANFGDSRFAWQGDGVDTTVTANLMHGDFYAEPVNNGWNFNFDEFTISVNDKMIRSNWVGRYDENGRLSFSAMEPIDLTPFIPMVGVMLGEEAISRVNQLSPTIELASAQFLVDEGFFATEIDFRNLSVKQQPGIPGINNMAGTIAWQGLQGLVSISSSDNKLSSEQVLGFDLEYDHLDIQTYVDLRDPFQKLYFPKIHLKNDIIELNSTLTFELETREMAISSNLTDVDMVAIKSLLPNTLIGPNTLDYLNRGILKGTLASADVLWQGKTANYPFNNNSGIFQANLDVQEMDFKFAREWPELNNINASFLFENRSLSMRSNDAALAGFKLSEVSAVLPVLDASSTAVITAKAEGTSEQFTSLMQNSSLADSVGRALKTMLISGPMTADLNLSVPLTGEDIVATGVGYFDNNRFSFPRLNLDLENFTGSLNFENETLSSNDIITQILNQQVQLTIEADASDEGYKTDITLAGNWQLDPIMAEHFPGAFGYFSGASDWQGQLNLTFPEGEGYNYDLQISSQLAGVDIDLPAPVGKTSEQTKRLIFNSEGNQQASNVRMILGPDVKFNGIYPHKERKFSRAHLAMGNDNFVGMGLGFSVSADVEKFEFSPWYRFVASLVDGSPKSKKPILGAPLRVFIEAQEAIILGQSFDEVEILGKNRQTDWLLDINSEQTRANVTVFKDWHNEGVAVDADFIKLDRWSKEETGDKPLNTKLLPPISLVCKQCDYKKYNLGQITLNMSRSQTGMNIDLLEMRKRDGVLSATGAWNTEQEQDVTRLQGNFNSDDFGAFLKDLEFDSGIRDSNAVMNFDLSWDKSLYEFNTATLQGDIDYRLGEGYVTEISDKGARIFSILSLESLFRKLRFDFRDVFAKGFFYNNMEGTFDVQKGIVRTEDTIVDGTAATVAIKGYTDLNDQNISYGIGVKPNVTSSLPVLLAWMVNPATAVAALALDGVFTSADVISSLNYSLTGTLTEPVVTEMNRESREVPLPAQVQPDKTPELEPAIPPESDSPEDSEG